MQVIIMAAGQGSRMQPLTNTIHKSLLPINKHETFLSRLFHQLNEYEISKVVLVVGYKSEDVIKVANEYQLNTEIVYNDKYEQDTNIYSMKLALEKVNVHEPIIVIEADIYIDDLALRDIIKESQKGNSVWFTKNKFKKGQYGGILHKNLDNDIDDIKIVLAFESKYKDYDKLLGIMTIGVNEIALFKTFVNQYTNETIEQYYLVPWIKNLEQLHAKGYDLGKYLIESVNKVDEYELFVHSLQNRDYPNIAVELINIAQLLEIEEHIAERKDLLKKQILDEGIWNKPIVVEKNHNLILDGHHRFNIAKEIGLTKIPAILVDYDDIEVWSLKNAEHVTKNLVIEKAKTQNIYPNKTVKHKFNFHLPACKYHIKELR